MTTIDYVHEHLAPIDTSQFAKSQIPAEFRNLDHVDLNGIEGPNDSEDPTGWDYARFAEAS